MKLLGKVGLGLLAVVAVLVAVVAFRTATFKPASAVDITAVKLAAPLPVDQQKAAANLAWTSTPRSAPPTPSSRSPSGG